MLKLNIREHLTPATSMAENPARRARWKFMMEGMDQYVRGYTRADPEALDQKRKLCENMMDAAIRRVVMPDEDGPTLLDHSAIPALYEHHVRSQPIQLVEDTTIGWSTPGSIPATDKIFTTQSLGMVRRVFPRMIATDLISTQPISQPTGKIFYRDLKYDTNAGGGVSQGDRLDDTAAWTFAGQRDYAKYVDTNGTNATSAIGEGVTAREIKLDISSITVTAETAKLAAEWSVEVQQDLRSYHGMDADGELTSALAEEITREIDRDLINFIYTTARDSGAGTTFWNKNGYSGSLPSEQKAWDETFWDAIEDTANLIEGKRYRRPTWLLANHNTCGRIRKLNGFRSMNESNGDLQIMTGGRRLFGTLQNTFYVYCDPWFDDDVLVMGYKGNAFFESGIIYSPYIAFYRTPMFTNPVTFMNQRGVMSRYAKTAAVPTMYARLVITSS